MTLADIDLSAHTGAEVLDQGERPLCVAFAVSAAHEALLSQRGARCDQLAPEPIWADAVASGVASPLGMPINAAAGGLDSPGQPPLADWPYSDSIGWGTEQPPPSAGTPPWNRASLTEFFPAMDGVEAELESWLERGRVVAVVVAVPPEFYRPIDGYVDEPVRGFAGTASHAVACVGAITHPDRGRMLYIKNSWGPLWGVGGYGYVPLSYLRLSVVVPQPF